MCIRDSPNAPSTALAMFPTPDCNGRKVDGMIPRFMSAARKSATFCPILSVNGSAAAKERASSGQLVSVSYTHLFTNQTDHGVLNHFSVHFECGNRFVTSQHTEYGVGDVSYARLQRQEGRRDDTAFHVCGKEEMCIRDR